MRAYAHAAAANSEARPAVRLTCDASYVPRSETTLAALTIESRNVTVQGVQFVVNAKTTDYPLIGLRLQAALLNRLVDDLFSQRGVKEEQLRELLVHTPVEVLTGATLGVAEGVLFPA